MSSKPTILCVDDQAANLQIRAMLLEQFGCVALTALNHRSALQVASEYHVDLAVVDYHLANGETGEEVARDLRVMFPRLPMIMLTGDSNLPSSAVQAVDAVIVKGCSNPGNLFEEIQELLPDAELRPRRPLLVKNPRENSEAPDQPESKGSSRSEKAT